MGNWFEVSKDLSYEVNLNDGYGDINGKE